MIPNCFCGAKASLQNNSLLYNGKSYGNGKAWICTRFPECRGAVGTHPDGRPLGSIVDQATKNLRMEVHALIDPLWRHGKWSRKRVYKKLSAAIGKTYHTGDMNAKDCEKLLEMIPKLFGL